MALVRVDLDVRQKGTGIETTVKGMREIQGRQPKVKKGFTDINVSMVKLAAAAGTAYAALRLVSGALEASAKQQAAINKLNIALENQGNFTRAASEALQEHASALQKVTRFGDELIIENQALLASFGMNEAQIRKSTEAALDFAAATGRDLTAVVNLLGKAFVGETGELSRYGIIIDKTIPKTQKFAEVLSQVTTRFGGQAQAEVLTYTGQIEQLSNTWGDLMEALGETIADNEGGLGVLGRLNMILTELTATIKDLKGAASGGFFADLGDFWEKAKSGGFGLPAQALAQAVRFGSPAGAAVGMFGAMSGSASDRQAAREQERLMNQFVGPTQGGPAGPSASDTASALEAATKARKAELAQIEKFRREIAAGAVQRNYDDASRALIETAHSAGEAGKALDSGIITPAEEMVTALIPAKTETLDWGDSLNNLANQLIVVSQTTDGFVGALARFAAGIAASIASMKAGFDTFKTGQGIGGFGGLLGQITGIGGLVSGGLGIVGGIKSLFGGGGPSREERAAQRAAEEAERLADELERAERRAKGLESAIGGLRTLIDNLTFTDEQGNIFNTFSDPQMAQHAGTLFSSTFWAVWREQGIAGLDKLRPMWEELHQQLIDLGLDPTALGLGRIGDLMTQTDDPRTRALLGVSQGSSQMIQGMMDAGFMSRADLEAAGGLTEAAMDELIAQGIDEATAANLLSSDLATLAKAYEAQGEALPQWLQDAMEAAGIDVLPSQLKVLEESLGVQKETLRVLGGLSSFQHGGSGDFGTGSLAVLHGNETIIPTESLGDLIRRGQAELAAELGVASPGRPATPDPVVQITQQPTFNIDPLVSAEGRKDLGKFLIDELVTATRNDPTVQYAIRRAAERG